MGKKALTGGFPQHVQVTGGPAVPDAFSAFPGPTGHSDRSWLFVIAMSLILCVCLSVVYNRFLQLEQWAYRMEFANRRAPTPASFGQPLRSPAAPEGQSVCSEEVESLRLLVKSVSQVMDQMQRALEVLERRVENLTSAKCQTRSPTWFKADPRPGADETVIGPPVGTRHRLCHQHVLLITSPDEDIGQEMPLPEPWMHPSRLMLQRSAA
ncbi:unnamed protein product, partial [Dibothriocephalus latus]